MRWEKETAEVKQVRWEARGSLQWLQHDAAMAAVGPLSLLISEIKKDSAASLKTRIVKKSASICVLALVRTPADCASLPTRLQRHRRASVTIGPKALLLLLE